LRALAICLLLSAAAAAQDQRMQARQKFEDGRLQFSGGHYREALALFRESYQLAPYPALLFNIARCHEQLGEFHDALEAYEHYLAVNPQDAEARARAEEMRERAPSEPARLVEPSPPPVAPPRPPDGLVGIPEHPLPPSRTPVYKKWWLWTAVVGGVAAVALGVGLGVGLSGADPQRTFPPLSAQ
jgi:tetratricopeptide (TPR) repeat protein